MSEEEKQELRQEAAGGTEKRDTTETQEISHADATAESGEESGEPAGEPDDGPESETDQANAAPQGGEDSGEPAGEPNDGPESEIDDSNAEDAEDEENQRRHHIPFLDYHSLSMENLVGELQRLLRTEKVQAIRKHVDSIKHEFDLKFQDFMEQKKEEFVNRGGNASDFRYNSVTKRQFNELYDEYREKRNQYYNTLEQNLKQNLEARLGIIEELKGLVNVEEDMNTTYKSFKELQERWKTAGAIPRGSYNDVWRTYQHHVEIFYDFLSLNRELRDLDFKYNLEEKEKLCERAEALADEADINKAFRELQVLHKIWKEDVGPVAKEQREPIWQRFSEATKKIHQRRQEHFQELDQKYQANLEEKQKIIAQIAELGAHVAGSHREIQKQIRQVEALREQFFQAGKVPHKDNEPTWAAFKKAVRAFNRNKNAFYKNLKQEQQENLDRKKELLERALALRDSEDWEAATPEMKQIQLEWKQIGHVPRKFSDKIWKQFKEACNHYFNRLHENQDSAFAAENKNLELKSALLDQLRDFKLSGKREKDLEALRDFVSRWKEVGHVPRNKKHITSKFYKILDALLRKLGVGKQEAEILKYGDKIAQLADAEDQRAIEQERQFIRKKIEEAQGEVRQLENNLNFFSNASEDSPLVKEVIENLEGKKAALEGWKAKLKKLNILRNTLEQEADGGANGEGGTAEDGDPDTTA